MDVGTTVSIALSAVAVLIAGVGVVYAGNSAKAAAESAKAGQRSAAAAERSAAAAEALVPVPPPPVGWELTRRQDKYLLRNTGDTDATQVRVMALPETTTERVQFPNPPDVVPAGEAVPFFMSSGLGATPATSLLVHCAEIKATVLPLI